MSPEVAAVIISGVALVITAIIKFVPRRANPGHNNPGHNSLNNKYVRKDMCDQKMENIEEKIDGLCKDVKELLSRR